MKVIFIIVLLITHLSGCSPNLVEISRVNSTDQQAVVIVANRETSATVPTPTELYLVAFGGKPEGEPFWRADNVEGLNISWLSKHVVVVTARRARVFRAERSSEVTKVKGARSEKIEIQYRIDTTI
jgi:hypothetical protein